MTVVEFQSVSKHYGSKRALDDVSFVVTMGQSVGVIGPNGSGKTTAFGLLLGLSRPTLGQIRIDGRELSTASRPTGAVMGTIQDVELPRRMRARALLVQLGRYEGGSAREAERRADEALISVGLQAEARSPVGKLSFGQKRRLEIATLLGTPAKVLVFDEPTYGLDPRAVSDVRTMLKQISTTRTVILSSHNLDEVETLCSHVLMLEKGKVRHFGALSELRNTATRIEAVVRTEPGRSDALVASIRDVAGFRGLKVMSEPGLIGLSFTVMQGGEGDASQHVLQKLIALGLRIESFERGEKLESKFLKMTGQDSNDSNSAD